MPETPTAKDDLPPASAELVLWRIHIEALTSVLGRKKAERYLRLMAEKLADEENLASVFHLRPLAEQEAVRRARRQASTVYQRYLPIFLARLPR